jgi:hypothetical protein
MRPRGSDKFLGWHYIYYLRHRQSEPRWSDTADVFAEVFFDPRTNQLTEATTRNIPGVAKIGGK